MKYLLFPLFFLFSLKLFAQTVQTVAGTGAADYSGDNGYASGCTMNMPSYVAFDYKGNMYVADWNNNVIRKIDKKGIITTVAGNGYGAGIPGVGDYSGDNGPATAARLYSPAGIVFDGNDNMYFCDENNMVIRKVNKSGIITTIAGTGAIGYNGDGQQATATDLFFPIGLVFDNNGDLFFSDKGNRRVRKINMKAGIVTTIAGTGIAGGIGDGMAATVAQLRQPSLLTISPVGDLYIPDYADHRVRKVDMTTGIITTVAGTGASTSIEDGDGGPATAAAISGCQGIVFDGLGNYYISNNTTCTIRKVNSAGIISTVMGGNTCGFDGDGGPASAAHMMRAAVCSAIDAAGNLYFADPFNNRIRRITYNATSVNELTGRGVDIRIYPNPARDEVVIETGELSMKNEREVGVYNVLGTAMYKLQTHERRTTINTWGYASGLYFVLVDGVYAGKFVKE